LSEFGFLTDFLTLILLLAGMAIFGYLTVVSKSIKKFQFQISVFILIWIAGEIASQIQSFGVISDNLSEIGLEIHLISMVFFAVLVWARFLSSKNQNKSIVDDPNDILK
jgi:hypothetical protein